VDPASIIIEKVVVKNAAGKTATFGVLAERAQKMVLTGPFTPKVPSQWRLIGKDGPRVDTVPKTDGTARFTIDVKLPEMLTCLIARPSRFGAKVQAFEDGKALAVPGV
jgi:isoquinoline 1-oxidoreductase beta subunit